MFRFEASTRRQSATFLLQATVLACFLSGTASIEPQTPVEATQSSLIAHVPYPSGAGTVLGEQIATLLAGPGVRRAHWGIAVTDLDGTPIYGLDEGKLFRPASNTKLFTTAAAMAFLGAGTRVETRAAGAVDLQHLEEGGTLRGDLMLAGSGDANLSGRSIPYLPPAARKLEDQRRREAGLGPPDPLAKFDQLANELAQGGLKRVTGDVVGDDTLWPSEPYIGDWTLDDATGGDGPPVSALSVMDNVLTIEVLPGAKAGGKAAVKLTPEIPFYTVESSVTTVAEKKDARIRIDHHLNTRAVRVLGTIAVGQPYSNEVSLDDPAEFAALALKLALEANGVQVNGKAVARHRASLDARGFFEESHSTSPPLLFRGDGPLCGFAFLCEGAQGKTLAVIPSPTLAEDVAVTLKVSQNLHAELLLRRLGKLMGTEGTAAQGERVVREFLLKAGVDGDDFVLYDGSGLSGHNLVAPRATAQLLSYAARQPWFAVWKAALPVGGVDGSLASRFPDPPLKNQVFAKTGTLGESRALSGYLNCASGKTVIFSIMVDNHMPGGITDRDAMDRLVAAIAAAN